jgi:hypothetical protein
VRPEGFTSSGIEVIEYNFECDGDFGNIYKIFRDMKQHIVVYLSVQKYATNIGTLEEFETNTDKILNVDTFHSEYKNLKTGSRVYQRFITVGTKKNSEAIFHNGK